MDAAPELRNARLVVVGRPREEELGSLSRVVGSPDQLEFPASLSVQYWPESPVPPPVPVDSDSPCLDRDADGRRSDAPWSKVRRRTALCERR